jgi:phosphatidylinositol-3-phosphatase
VKECAILTDSRRRLPVLLVLGLLIALLVGVALGRVGQGAAPSATRELHAAPVALSTPTPHLVVVVMENKDYAEVVGSVAAPYINGTLIPSGTSWTNFFAVDKPSLPNYLVLTSGTFGSCTADDCPVQSIDGPNLFSRLEGVGSSWKVYAEGMPSPCYLGTHRQYAPRHNPAVYYTSLGPSGSNTCVTNDVSMKVLPTDLVNGTLPDLSFVIPDLHNDMHSHWNASPCGPIKDVNHLVCQGDNWLQQWAPQILSDGGRNDVTLVLAWDEGGDTTGGGGHAPLIVVGPTTCSGCRVAEPATGYGLANAFLGWFGLPPYPAPTVSLDGS